MLINKYFYFYQRYIYRIYEYDYQFFFDGERINDLEYDDYQFKYLKKVYEMRLGF